MMKQSLWLIVLGVLLSGGTLATTLPPGQVLFEVSNSASGVGLVWFDDAYDGSSAFTVERKLATDPETAWQNIGSVSRAPTVEAINATLDGSSGLDFMFWDMWGPGAPSAGVIDDATWDSVFSDSDNWQRSWDLAVGALRGLSSGTGLARLLGRGYVDSTAIIGTTYDYRVLSGFNEYARETVANNLHVDPFLPGFQPRPGETDLALSKAVDIGTPKAGDTVVFSLSVDNTGTAAATSLQVRDFLESLDPGSIVSISHGSFDTSTGLWDVGTLDGGTSALLEYEALVPSGALPGSTLENTARIDFYEQYDPAAANNFASSSVTVVPAPAAVTLFVLAILGVFARRSFRDRALTVPARSAALQLRA